MESSELSNTLIAVKRLKWLVVAVIIAWSAYICSGGYFQNDFNACQLDPTYHVLLSDQSMGREKLMQALKLPLHYRGREGPFYLFETHDHSLLLQILSIRQAKLFFPSQIRKVMPYFLRQAHSSEETKRLMQLQSEIHSLQIAGTALKEECGVLYIKLNPDPSLPKAKLINGLGLTFEFDLTDTQFVLQKKPLDQLPSPDILKKIKLDTLSKGIDFDAKGSQGAVRMNHHAPQYLSLHKFKYINHKNLQEICSDSQQY